MTAIEQKAKQLYEYSQILQDPAYAIENYMQTFDMTQNGFVPFNLFEGQKRLIKNYVKERYNLCLKYRQAGISTVTAAYCAVILGFASPENPEKVLILANKQDTSIEFLNKITTFIKQLPAWAGINFEKSSQKHVKITNAEGRVIGEMKAVATSKDALRGFTPTLMILDEAAFIEGGQELWAACLASIGTGGKAILISTPNGLDEIYYAAYESSITGRNNFCLTDLKWWQDPRYNKDLRLVETDDIIEWMQTPVNERHSRILENAFTFNNNTMETLISQGFKPHSTWYQNMCKDMNFNKRMINQELECAFLGSGDNVVEAEVLRKQEVENVRAPIIKDRDWEHHMWIWKQPEAGHRYIMALDVSRGDSEDATGATIIDFDTWEQVAEYHGKVPPDIAAKLVDTYGRLYNAVCTFDITGGMGIAATRKLRELKFPTKLLHYDNHDDLEAQYFGVDEDTTPGINFAKSNRRVQIIQALEEALRTGFKMRSERLAAEIKKFVYKNGKPDHMKGSHDDLIMALGMCLYVANTSFKKLIKQENTARAMLDSWKVNNAPAPQNAAHSMLKEVIDSKPEENKIYGQETFREKQAVLQNTKDFSWVFGNISKYKPKQT